VEIKKKYDKVVYKRRLSMPEEQAMQWLKREKPCEIDSQIAREIDYFLEYYAYLKPVLFLSYEREAYYCKEDSDFRITFDENVLCRQDKITFQSDIGGTPVLEEDKVLMEIKCVGGIPLWMTQILSKEKLYKTSFSKYGTAYQNIIYTKIKGEQI
jgi:hypothetical protein